MQMVQPIEPVISTRTRQSKRRYLVCCLCRKAAHGNPARTEPVQTLEHEERKYQPASPLDSWNGEQSGFS